MRVGGNVIQASDGGSTITMDTSDNVTIAGDLTVTGGDIDLSGEISNITLIDNTSNALQIGASGQTMILAIDTTDDTEVVKAISDSAAAAAFQAAGLPTLTGDIADGYAGGIRLLSTYNASHTVTRHNYIQLDSPSVVSATVTDACVFRFGAAAGTHKAVDSGSAHPDIDTTDAWIKVNINGTIHYIPAYTDKS